MWKMQIEQQRKADRERLRAERENTELEIITPELDNFGMQSEDDQIERQIVIKSTKRNKFLYLFIYVTEILFCLFLTFQLCRTELCIRRNTR